MAVTGKDTLMTNVPCHSACSAVCLPDNAFVFAPLWTAISGFESLAAGKSNQRLRLISLRQAEEAKTPHVAPGLQLPDSGGVVLLDTFQNQPQLDELQQSGGELKKNMKGNILRAAINPIASAKQTIEIPGPHAKIQAHVTLPAIYVNVDQQDQPADNQQPQKEPELPWDRFKIVRMQEKQGKRIVGDIKIAVYGKVSQEQKLVPTTAAKLTGGWVKVTPSAPLATGEYAVVELLGKEGMNFYVWDFGVNPAAPANPMAWKPEPSSITPPPE